APDPFGSQVSSTKDFKIPPNILLEESKRGGRKDNLEGFQRPQGKTFDGIDVSILKRLKRSPGREHFARHEHFAKVARHYWTRAAQHFPSARSLERHAGSGAA
ncbi:unnamed protein product, partial [Ascophyllum nodosum]